MGSLLALMLLLAQFDEPPKKEKSTSHVSPVIRGFILGVITIGVVVGLLLVGKFWL